AAAAAARGRAFIAPIGRPVSAGPTKEAGGFFIGLAAGARLGRAVDLIARFAPDWAATPSIAVIHRDDPVSAAAARGAVVDLADAGLPAARAAIDFTAAADPTADALGGGAAIRLAAGPPALLTAMLGAAEGEALVAVARCRGLSLDALAAARGLCGRDWAADMAFEDPFFGDAAGFGVAFDARFGRPPTGLDAAAAAVIAVYAAALEAASDFDARRLRAALSEINLMTVYGRVRFGPEGRNLDARGVLSQARDGVLVSVAPEQWAPARPELRMPPAR
ncbi:MAG: hypothetical protein AAF684_01975, partial [Pseudomonadota bacterium]